MKKSLFCLCVFCLVFLMACATAGQKTVTLSFTGDAAPSKTGKIGLSEILDMRTGMPQKEVGHRVLLDNSRETYLVSGADLGKSLTRTIQTYLDKKGYLVKGTASWEPSTKGVSAMPKDFTGLVSGAIRQFECRAIKKAARTTMTFDIDLTLYIGFPAKGTLKKIPVMYHLEETVFTFSEKKLEAFINGALAEIFIKTLVF